MSVNDQVILDNILSKNSQNIATELTEAEYFEIFTAEQIVKDYDLSYDEIKSGIVSGANDGGIDSIYLFVNGELILEDTDVAAFKKDVTIDLFFIQSKRTTGFSESAIDKFSASANDL